MTVTRAETTRLTLRMARDEARRGGAAQVEPGHLLIGLCRLVEARASSAGHDGTAGRSFDDDIAMLRSALDGLDIDPRPFRRALRRRLARPASPREGGAVPHRSEDSRRVFGRAERIAEEALDSRLRPVHLLTALLELDEPFRAELLAPEAPAAAPTQPEAAAPVAQAPRATPLLDRMGRDLTQLARDGLLSPLIGRRDEMRSLGQILMQQRKRSAILIGEAGVGKTGIVEGLAQRLVQDPQPALAGVRIVELQMSALSAAQYRGEFEERMHKLLAEAAGNEHVILFIDEIHTLLGAGGKGAADAANIVKPALARGDIRIIGATTIAEYRRSIERDPALERRFAAIWVQEPTRDEAIAILGGLRTSLQDHHGVAVADEAIEAAVDLSIRYLPEQRLPDKAIDLIDAALAVARLATLSPDRRAAAPAAIGRAEVAAIVSRRCRVPLERLTRDEAQRLLALETELSERVIGQPEAVSAVAQAVRTARAGIGDPRRPIAVLLFTGPTGTGKTELAKALAAALFDDERHLVRIDMSEYKERHSLSRLIGAPPGYVGYEEQEGLLTGPVRTNPHCVVLFDEIEKAHPEVLDLCLQIFDEGRLTDTRGRTASFREALIILTSNLGTPSRGRARRPGFAAVTDPPAAGARDAVDRALAAALRPELLNRIQRIVVFRPLDRDGCRRILDKILGDVRTRLRDQRRVELELSESACALLIAQGFDERFGARELERTVQRLLVEPLATALLSGSVRAGSRVRVDAGDGRLTFG